VFVRLKPNQTNVLLQIVKFNYGMEDKNPLEKVRFYTKDHFDEPIRLAKNQVSEYSKIRNRFTFIVSL
jgi:hypothetical protein